MHTPKKNLITPDMALAMSTMSDTDILRYSHEHRIPLGLAKKYARKVRKLRNKARKG